MLGIIGVNAATRVDGYLRCMGVHVLKSQLEKFQVIWWYKTLNHTIEMRKLLLVSQNCGLNEFCKGGVNFHSISSVLLISKLAAKYPSDY